MKKTNEQKTQEVLTRGVSEIIVKEDLRKKLESGKKLKIYFGIDPTGSLLHLGHAVILWKLKEFQELGHEVILLIGDFTAKIGDPTGKDAARVPLTDKQIKENFKDYKKQASKILDFSKIKIKYNSTWLSKLKFADILELSGHFTVQQMLHRDMFQRRFNFIHVCPNCGKENIVNTKWIDNNGVLIPQSIGVGSVLVKDLVCPFCSYGNKPGENPGKILSPQPIFMQEFLYPLMQGYDSVAMNVDLEIGGNDQMFNMLAGRTLQKIYHNKDKDILTTKLLLGTDGRKMSKTYDNAIYLTDESNNMFGKLMSIKDELIADYFELGTDLPIVQIAEIKKMPNPRDQKALLAREIVKMYYGEKAAQEAQEQFNAVFKNKEMPTDVPVFETSRTRYAVVDLLFDAKLAESKNDAKRVIDGGGVEVDNERIADWKKEVEVKDGMVVKFGKRKFIKIKLKK